MAVNTRTVYATPVKIWEVLSEGWLYPLWVVGASRMREVEDSWPAIDSNLHHSFGVWPVLVDDSTEVVGSSAGHSLSLRARVWPVGEAIVKIDLAPAERAQT